MDMIFLNVLNSIFLMIFLNVLNSIFLIIINFNKILPKIDEWEHLGHEIARLQMK